MLGDSYQRKFMKSPDRKQIQTHSVGPAVFCKERIFLAVFTVEPQLYGNQSDAFQSNRLKPKNRLPLGSEINTVSVQNMFMKCLVALHILDFISFHDKQICLKTLPKGTEWTVVRERMLHHGEGL